MPHEMQKLQRNMILAFLALVSSGLGVLMADRLLVLWIKWGDLSSEWRFSYPRVLNTSLISTETRFLEPALYEAFRQAKKPLAVALGDSFTLGFNVENCPDPREVCAGDLSYPGRLQTMLSASGSDLQVVNAGVGDTSPGQQLRLFEELVLPELRPTVVLWQFYANDLAGNAYGAVFSVADGTLEPIDASANWLYRRQLLFETIPLSRETKRRSGLVRLLMLQFERQKELTVPPRYRRDVSAWGLKKLKLQVSRMRELASRVAFKLYIILITPQSVYLAKEDPEAWGRFWEIRDHHLILEALVDEDSFLLMEFNRTDLDQVIRVPVHALLFADGESDPAPFGSRHLSAQGYELVARKIFDHLRTDGIVP